jgi:LysR family transcriptional regulator, cyn operon transcriptional activator
MNLRQLRYFLAVAEQRHFTRAAAACFVSQPALSQQIRALEEDLGAPLFDRLPSGAQLTTEGRVLRAYAARILRELENARAAVEEAAGAVRGELTIATVHTANLDVVVEGLAAFRSAHPNVVVRVHEEPSEQVVASVLSGKVNVGVSYLPVPDEEIEADPLYEEELVLVVPGGDPRAGGTIELAAIGDLGLIVPPNGFCLRSGIEEALMRASCAPRIVAEVSALESICEAVRAGLGATLLPLAYTRRSGVMSGLDVVRLSPTPRRTVATLRHTDRHLCLASRAFLRTLRQVVGKHDGQRNDVGSAVLA